jgi:hypothetical protein
MSSLLRESWDALIRARAAGGFVFEFADEWWKNYNNPSRSGDSWTRVPAPDDELRHDDDPEEYYGIVQADRTARPAFNAVTTMFVERTGTDTARAVGATALASLVIIAGAAWLWARRRADRGPAVGAGHAGA